MDGWQAASQRTQHIERIIEVLIIASNNGIYALLLRITQETSRNRCLLFAVKYIDWRESKSISTKYRIVSWRLFETPPSVLTAHIVIVSTYSLFFLFHLLSVFMPTNIALKHVRFVQIKRGEKSSCAANR